MSLLQISEPNQSSNPHQHQYALGIDLGTTRSLVAVVRSGQPQLIEANNPEDTLLPSVVYYGSKQAKDIQAKDASQSNDLHQSISSSSPSPLVGEAALAHAISDAKNTIISSKRFMGRSLADIKFSHPYDLIGEAESMPAFVTAQGNKTPVEVAANILSTLKQRAEAALPQDSIQGAVITVPAYFDEAQRQATKDAAKYAGIKVLRLLNEPTAAAVAYGLDRLNITQPAEPNESTNNLDAATATAKTTATATQLQSRYFLIYDLGGGTFDVSILKLTDGMFEVLATGGNSALGGDDIDRLLANWLIKQAGQNPAILSDTDKNQLKQIAKRYKQALTEQTQIEVEVQLADSSWTGTLNQQQLTQIMAPVTRRTISVCEQVLRDAKLGINQLDEIILVGGSTRMPIIQSAVEQFFGKPALCNINPDTVVALGAAQTAQQLIKQTDDNLLLLDVTPLSLGLETMGDLVEVIIPRNTPIPVSKRQMFTTYQDGQTGMVIHILQGERDTVEDNRSLGKFELAGIPPMKAGLARIEVTFSIDVNGQLTVKAQETTTGTHSEIDIVPSYGLTDTQKEQLLLAGFHHAQSDKQARTLRETKLEANRELLALKSALQEYQPLLTADTIDTLQQAMQALDKALTTNELSQIIAAQTQLKPHSDAFAAVIMNQSIQQSMAGTKAEDW